MNFLLTTLGLMLTFFSIAQCPTPDFLASAYNSNNGQRGNMFDLTAGPNSVNVVCFASNLYAGTTATYEIFYKTGTYLGSENTPGNWTLVGSTTNLTSLGLNVPTPIPINVNIVIPAGQTYGFYVTNTSGGGTKYTNGLAANTVLASDANLSLTGGVGKSYPFSTNFYYRDINAHVYYEVITPLPVEVKDFWLTSGVQGVTVSWQSVYEHNHAKFEIFRSTDASNWTKITELSGEGDSQMIKHYNWLDKGLYSGLYYYKLVQIDTDGNQREVAVKTIELGKRMEQVSPIYPNPSNGVFYMDGFGDDLEEISFFDFLGTEITDQVIIQPIDGAYRFAFPKGSSGFVLMRKGSETFKLLIVD